MKESNANDLERTRLAVRQSVIIEEQLGEAACGCAVHSSVGCPGSNRSSNCLNLWQNELGKRADILIFLGIKVINFNSLNIQVCHLPYLSDSFLTMKRKKVFLIKR
jgi:hypothetical protein